MRVLDLFSGIGGFSLGLERAGMQTIAFCEIDPFCRRVLAKHWPDVPIHEDVRTLRGSDVEAVDVICGGFPCQDISTAGKGAGLAGERSGLWREYARLIGEIRPRYIIVENVAALLGRGLGTVLGDLAEIGYDAEWHCIPASAVGAPHIRDRVWIIAYPQHSNTDSIGPHRAQEHIDGDAKSAHQQVRITRPLGEVLADSQCFGCPTQSDTDRNCEKACAWEANQSRGGGEISNAHGEPMGRLAKPWGQRSPWLTEPDVGRVAHGIPSRAHRLRALGNAVVPQIPEIIGRAILKAESVSDERDGCGSREAARSEPPPAGEKRP